MKTCWEGVILCEGGYEKFLPVQRKYTGGEQMVWELTN